MAARPRVKIRTRHWWVVGSGEDAQTKVVEVKAVETKPPARYTESTLLSAMEGAGKLVDDEELRAAMSEKGLGTPGYARGHHRGIDCAGLHGAKRTRELVATAKGLASSSNCCEAFSIQALTSPELTGEWEAKLKQMESGANSSARTSCTRFAA